MLAEASCSLINDAYTSFSPKANIYGDHAPRSSNSYTPETVSNFIVIVERKG